LREGEAWEIDGGGGAEYRGGGEVEVNETKGSVEDASNATRAAIEEAVVPGGRVALLNAAKVLAKLQAPSLEQKTGVDIVLNAVR
jgi:chaperonin GroEL